MSGGDDGMWKDLLGAAALIFAFLCGLGILAWLSGGLPGGCP